MSADEQARVSREIDANVHGSLMRRTEDLWKRLREGAAHMVDRLNEPELHFVRYPLRLLTLQQAQR